MKRELNWRWSWLAVGLLLVPWGWSQPPQPKATPPRLEAVAETKLVMDGIAQANYDGLTKLLANKPTEQEAWVFARGQALIIAESANLLMIRPPRTKPQQDVWMTRAMEMRSVAKALGQAAAAKDYLASRAALAKLANQCNRCHADFAVKHRIAPIEPTEK